MDRFSAVIVVHGHEERSKTLVANTGQTGATASNDANFSNDHAQPFHHRQQHRRLPSDRRAGRDRHRQSEHVDRPDLRGEHPVRFVRRSRQQARARSKSRPSWPRGVSTFTAAGPGIKLGTSETYFLLMDVSAAGNQGRQGRTHGRERRGFGRGDGLEHREHLPAEEGTRTRTGPVPPTTSTS